jgi:hypothetical protein
MLKKLAIAGSPLVMLLRNWQLFLENALQHSFRLVCLLRKRVSPIHERNMEKAQTRMNCVTMKKCCRELKFFTEGVD